MATVQQLEKLHYIQRQFIVADSLESAVAADRLGRIIEKTEQLIRQRAFLRDERRLLRQAATDVEEKNKALERIRRPDWLPASVAAPVERHIRINVGGLMFEACESVLKRDPESLLAELCGAETPVPLLEEGFFFFDRDWWLFRFILTFMRDGTLPEDRGLLTQLYREASFWKLKQLQIAIEENKLHLREPPSKEEKDKAAAAIWWRKIPSWWLALEAEEEKKKKEAEEKKKKEAAEKKKDWWLDTKYKDVTYLPIPPLTREEIEEEKKKEKEKALTNKFTTTTWNNRDGVRESYDSSSSYWRDSSTSSAAAGGRSGSGLNYMREGISRGNGDPWLDLQQIRK